MFRLKPFSQVIPAEKPLFSKSNLQSHSTFSSVFHQISYKNAQTRRYFSQDDGKSKTYVTPKVIETKKDVKKIEEIKVSSIFGAMNNKIQSYFDNEIFKSKQPPKISVTVENSNEITKDLIGLKKEISKQLSELQKTIEKGTDENKSHSELQANERTEIIRALNEISQKLDENNLIQRRGMQSLIQSVLSIVDQLVISRNEQTAKLSEQSSALTKIAHIDSEELEKLKKLNDASESTLTTGAAYATILSVIIALLIFLYQSYDQKQKDKEAKSQQLERIRLKVEETQKKIDELQVTYADLKFKEETTQNHIKFLRSQLQGLVKSKDSSFFNRGRYEIEITKKADEINKQELKLRTIRNEMKALTLIVKNQRALATEFTIKQKLIGQTEEHDNHEIKGPGLN